MKLADFWILLPIAIVIIVAFAVISGDWIAAAITPGAVSMGLLVRMPASPVVVFTQATNANPASVLVLGSIAISTIVWLALGLGVVATIRRINGRKELKNA